MEVGAELLRKATKDYILWRNAGLHGTRIAVNVSLLKIAAG